MSTLALSRAVLVAAVGVLQKERVVINIAQPDGSKQQYEVFMCELTARDKTEYEMAMMDDPHRPWDTLDKEEQDARLEIRSQEIRERTVIACARDAEGNRLFTYDDIDFVGGMGNSIVEPMVLAAKRVNAGADKSLETLGKNSEATIANVSV
ncbi:hypothetical protein [Rubinisphaera sp.]|uniref:hypothetical protein n=1 Tax=Rubinisphaera sp. TaxID=2024857 RepID=UPI000C10CE62|nr:hypothetical protein [Rubinisphaera sp.]MBV07683.1 hypothetical protein [Rubinisphaera sp.]HCS53289.1 hypothetical protein [Planctomycetaceae bacterium]|tara:strand:- start:9708 stop:10163 length:456 start_codon:yes stop_codon:yes gene_type:complete